MVGKKTTSQEKGSSATKAPSVSASGSAGSASVSKRPSAAGKKVAQGSKITTSASSQTGTPRLERKKKKKGSAKKRKRLSRRFLIGSVIVVLLLAIGTGALAWNQWFRYDDTADIQGTWLIDGSSQTITITDTDMVMTEEVSYPYTLDTFRKTISFSFKQYNGSGSYAFSPERTTLVITETDADSGESVSTKLVKQ